MSDQTAWFWGQKLGSIVGLKSPILQMEVKGHLPAENEPAQVRSGSLRGAVLPWREDWLIIILVDSAPWSLLGQLILCGHTVRQGRAHLIPAQRLTVWPWAESSRPLSLSVSSLVKLNNKHAYWEEL